MKVQPQTLEQRRGQWLKGVLDLCVLGALRNRDAYGYELGKALDAAGLGPMKGGTLYPLLNRLETEGQVDTFWKPSELGPDRKYYRLNKTGERVLEEAYEEWINFSASTMQVMLEGASEAAT